MTPYEVIRAVILKSKTISKLSVQPDVAKITIRPDRLAQTDGLPAIVVQVNGSEGTWSLSGDLLATKYNVNIEVLTKRREEADMIADAIVALDGAEVMDNSICWNVFFNPPVGSVLMPQVETDAPIYQSTVTCEVVLT